MPILGRAGKNTGDTDRMEGVMLDTNDDEVFLTAEQGAVDFVVNHSPRCAYGTSMKSFGDVLPRFQRVHPWGVWSHILAWYAWMR